MLTKMEKKVYNIEDAQVSCRRIAHNPCASDEYMVDIEICNRVYSITTLASPFEWDEDICKRVYSEWNNGRHTNVIPENI